jgi:hypothetical protein
LLEAIRETLHVGQFSFVLTSRHQIIEFACSIAVQFLPPARNDALPAGKVSLLTRVTEQSFRGTLLALVVPAIAGWIYLLGSMFVKFLLWCFS